jgi:hypothetical protein
MIVKMRNEFIRQATDVEDGESSKGQSSKHL